MLNDLLSFVSFLLIYWGAQPDCRHLDSRGHDSNGCDSLNMLSKLGVVFMLIVLT